MIILLMIITAYVPGAGGINGGLYGAHCHAGVCTRLEIGHCACGPDIPFHTTFVVDGTPYQCVDRGGAIGNRNVDLVAGSLDDAYKIGKSRQYVQVWRPGGYEKMLEERLQRELRRLEQ